MTEERSYMTTMDSQFGTLTLIASDHGLQELRWPAEMSVRTPQSYEATSNPDHPVLRTAILQLGEYLEGKRTAFDLPFDLRGTEFQKEAWRALASIRYGTTTTYGQQAARLGRPKAARAVGAANGQNPISIILPCHRVVGANGSLTGFAGGLETKKQLLEFERANAPLLE